MQARCKVESRWSRAKGGEFPTLYAVHYALCWLALILFANPISADADVPLTSGEWVYFALWKLEANGLSGPVFASSRPLEREEVARVIANMRERIEDGDLCPRPHELELIRKLGVEFARDLEPKGLDLRGVVAGETKYGDGWGPHSASFWGAAGFYPSPAVMLYEEVDVGRGRAIVGAEGETASRRIDEWRWNYTADFRRAYVRFNRGECTALLGRQSLFWGPGHGGSLILSDNSPAFDMVLLTARFGSARAIAFSAVLDKMWGERGDPPYRYLANRYLSGHRVDWIVSDRIELGLSELILYGGEARQMELQYVNPLLPYYASQWNLSQDDNTLVSADFAIRPMDGLKVYGEFLVDDFSYSGGDPNALGYIAGLYLSDPLGTSGVDFRAEYTRVDTWTYTHLETENQFTHYGWVMGHNLGPDADQLFLELSRMLDVDSRLKLSYTFGREGSRTVADRFRGEDYERINFPSGEVESRHRIGVQFLWEPMRGPQVDISFGGVFTRERDSTTQKSELSIRAGFLSGIGKPGTDS